MPMSASATAPTTSGTQGLEGAGSSSGGIEASLRVAVVTGCEGSRGRGDVPRGGVGDVRGGTGELRGTGVVRALPSGATGGVGIEARRKPGGGGTGDIRGKREGGGRETRSGVLSPASRFLAARRSPLSL